MLGSACLTRGDWSQPTSTSIAAILAHKCRASNGFRYEAIDARSGDGCHRRYSTTLELDIPEFTRIRE
jgi:hypothetical protein